MRRTFTLIELLVVVAIIAILAALLLPALARARFQAKCTVCLGSHHRQVLLGLSSYADDFDSRYPEHFATITGLDPNYLKYVPWGADISDVIPTYLGGEAKLLFCPVGGQLQSPNGAGGYVNHFGPQQTAGQGGGNYLTTILLMAGWNATQSGAQLLTFTANQVPMRAATNVEFPLTADYLIDASTVGQWWAGRWETAHAFDSAYHRWNGVGLPRNSIPHGYQDGSVSARDPSELRCAFRNRDWAIFFYLATP